jgi:outer membrane protein assembly factor BamA
MSLDPSRILPRLFATMLPSILACAMIVGGCRPFVKPVLPGQTQYAIDAVHFEPEEGAGPLAVDPTPLLQLLSVRPDIFIIAGQPWNPYRAAEDRRRIAVFWQNLGYFDVHVAMPTVAYDDTERTATVTWRIREGERYRLRTIDVRGAPPAFEAELKALVLQRPGDAVEVVPWRLRRHDMADVMRRAGHMRAEVYSRAWLDRDAGVVDWVYFVDAGPRSVVGEIRVVGAKRIPEAAIIARTGLQPGQPIDLERHMRLELDLADSGAFQNARIVLDTGTEFQTGTASWESWIPPDTGGIMRVGQVDADGQFKPRELPAAVDVTITVVEAPTVQIDGEIGVNMDPERIDPFIGNRIVWRNAFGPLHHLTIQGRVGYGARWRGDIDEPLGLYGQARLAWTRPGLFGRVGDFRLVGSFDDRLHPGYNWRTARVAAGVRWLVERQLFVDVEPSLRWDTGIGIGAPTAATAEALGLSTRSDTLAGELRLQMVWDTREDPVEALDGHLVALRLALAPVGTATWFAGALDLRYFVKLSQDLGLGFRVGLDQVHGLDDGGVPVGVRAFGGGAWGHRGFGTRRLGNYGDVCGGAAGRADDGSPACRSLALGAASLLEASAELRWLPYRKQFGAIAFVDAGAAGAGANPLEDGVEVAAGLGLRARLWHLTLSLDLAYRFTDTGLYDGLDRFLGFVRVGEAF